MSLEKTHVDLGFIPLTDCAPLAAAKTLGFYEEEGLDVSLIAQASWANVRDRLAAGLLDGAHMLGPMAVAQSLGLGSDATAIIAPMALNLNGSAITVSTAVADRLRQLDPDGMAAPRRSAEGLARLAAARRAEGLPPLTFAVVFPYSIHNYQLRYWLAAGGVRPDHDVRLTVVPPPRMVEKLAAGEIDGFCVTAPWNGLAVRRGIGEIVLFASDWWGATPDKVLGVTNNWAEENPRTLQAILRATLRGAAWCDEPENRPTLASILAQPAYVGAPEAALRLSLLGSPPLTQAAPVGPERDYIVFNRYAANFPWRSHALWFLSQMQRWGQAPRDPALEPAAAAVYRPDLYRTAAAAVGQAAPRVDLKVEGAHAEPWILGDTPSSLAMPADRLLDGRAFDPADFAGYVDGFEVGHPAGTPD